MNMSLRITFTKKVKTPPKKILQAWLEKVARREQRKVSSLAYIFVSDEELWEMNRKFLNHDALTDIITFDYSEDGAISGEIYISVDRVKENAEKYKHNLSDELLRVMAHGVLHLCGYKDKSPIQQKQMRAAEERAIKAFRSSPKA